MLVHYKNKAKKICGLTLQFNVGSFSEPKGYEGYMHVAEHFMFVATKSFTHNSLQINIEKNFESLQADTGRDFIKINCIFHINNFDEVINILQEMIYNWECPKENFTEEKEIIIDEARDFYFYQENKIFLKIVKQLEIINNKTPIGKVTDLKKITYKDVSKIKRFWNKQINNASTHAIAIGGSLEKKHLNKISNIFNVTSIQQKNNKNLLTGYMTKSDFTTVWFKGYQNEEFKSLLYRIYYFRWFDNYFNEINFNPHTVLDFWFCSVYSSSLTKQEIKNIADDIFLKPISKKEFDFAKKVLVEYLDKIIDSSDIIESLNFINNQYIVGNIKTTSIKPFELTKKYKSVKYKEFKDFINKLT